MEEGLAEDTVELLERVDERLAEDDELEKLFELLAEEVAVDPEGVDETRLDDMLFDIDDDDTEPTDEETMLLLGCEEERLDREEEPARLVCDDELTTPMLRVVAELKAMLDRGVLLREAVVTADVFVNLAKELNFPPWSNEGRAEALAARLC